jgi:hypothetical protein
MARRTPRRDRTTILLGVGFDGEDGHRRISRGRDFVLVGGSSETHEVLQDRAIRFNEELDRRGKRLSEVHSTEELREILQRAWE